MSEAVGHMTACGWMSYIVLKSVRWVPSLQGTNNNKYLEWMEYILIFDSCLLPYNLVWNAGILHNSVQFHRKT
jgi:hypothetical protein